MFWLMFTFDEHVQRHRSGSQPLQNKEAKRKSRDFIHGKLTGCKKKRNLVYVLH